MANWLSALSRTRKLFADTLSKLWKGGAPEGITLTASGLVDWLTLHTARYGRRDESVYFDGKYGLEFEVKGSRPTLGLKDAYLKENAVIRAIGTQSDLDFGDPDPPKKP